MVLVVIVEEQPPSMEAVRVAEVLGAQAGLVLLAGQAQQVKVMLAGPVCMYPVKKLTGVEVEVPAQLEQVLIAGITLLRLFLMAELVKYPLLLGPPFTMPGVAVEAGIILTLLQVMADPGVAVAVEVIITQDLAAREQIPEQRGLKVHQPPMAGQAEQIPEEVVGVLAVVVEERLAMADRE
jgi:hypothetical protein